MSYCLKCGEALPDNAVFCSKCGVRQRVEDERSVGAPATGAASEQGSTGTASVPAWQREARDWLTAAAWQPAWQPAAISACEAVVGLLALSFVLCFVGVLLIAVGFEGAAGRSSEWPLPPMFGIVVGGALAVLPALLGTHWDSAGVWPMPVLGDIGWHLSVGAPFTLVAVFGVWILVAGGRKLAARLDDAGPPTLWRAVIVYAASVGLLVTVVSLVGSQVLDEVVRAWLRRAWSVGSQTGSGETGSMLGFRPSASFAVSSMWALLAGAVAVARGCHGAVPELLVRPARWVRWAFQAWWALLGYAAVLVVVASLFQVLSWAAEDGDPLPKLFVFGVGTLLSLPAAAGCTALTAAGGAYEGHIDLAGTGMYLRVQAFRHMEVQMPGNNWPIAGDDRVVQWMLWLLPAAVLVLWVAVARRAANDDTLQTGEQQQVSGQIGWVAAMVLMAIPIAKLSGMHLSGGIGDEWLEASWGPSLKSGAIAVALQAGLAAWLARKLAGAPGRSDVNGADHHEADAPRAAALSVVPPLPWSSVGTTLRPLWALLALVGVAWAAFVVRDRVSVHRSAEDARSSCLSNIKQMNVGIMQYTIDYDERLPIESEALVESIYPYISNLSIWQCPSAEVFPSYRWNQSFSRRFLGDVPRPSEMVTMFESDDGINIAFRHRGQSNFGFFDGHAESLAHDPRTADDHRPPPPLEVPVMETELVRVQPGSGLPGRRAVVRTPGGGGVRLREEADNESQLLAHLPDGEVVRALEERGDWLRVRTATGRQGWVRWRYSTSRYLHAEGESPEVPPVSNQPASSTGQTSAGTMAPSGLVGRRALVQTQWGYGLNLRAEPATDSRQVGHLADGAAVRVLAERGDWLKVRTASGMECWARWRNDAGVRYLHPG